MKNLYVIGLSTCLTLSVVGQDLKTICVEDAKVSPALTRDLSGDARLVQMQRVAQALDSHLNASIAGSKKFKIVNRKDLDQLMREQNLADQGLVSKKGAKINNLTGAQYVLVTFIDSFQETTETAVFDGVHKMKRRFQASAQTTITDNSTSEILDASNVQVELVDVLDVIGTSNRPGGRTDEMMPKITRELAEKTTARLIEVLFPPKIIEVDGTTITINRGEGFFKRDDVITLFSKSKTVVDPDTNDKITIKGKAIGTARITFVDPTTAQAELAPNVTATLHAQVKKQEPSKE